MADQAQRRALVRTGTLGAGVLLLAALVVIVNYFGARYYKRFDWTATRLYSLSEKSKNVLAELDEDVTIYVFLGPQDELYEPVRELLRRYQAASPHVRVRFVDPEKNPVEAQQLVEKYEITSAGLVVERGEDRRVIDGSELAEMDFSAMQFEGGQPRMAGFKGEQAVSSALLQVTEGRKPKVLVTTGHGEARLDDVGPRGLSGAQQVLANDNFELEEWSPLGKPAVPPEANVVVVAGPTGTFVQPELDVLAAYLGRGGRLLVLLDPTLAGSGLVDTGLGRWLAGFGVKAGEDIVVDPSNPLPFFGPETIFANRYGDHAIVRPLQQGNLPVLLSLARSVGPGSTPGFPAAQLVETTEAGWGETNLAALGQVHKDPADVGGPVPLAVAVEGQAAEAPTAAAAPVRARLVVVGDSDFATNQLLQANRANGVLLANAVNWLVEREALLAIPPKKTEQVRLNLTQGQLRTVVLLAVVGLPVLALGAGIWVWRRRRR